VRLSLVFGVKIEHEVGVMGERRIVATFDAASGPSAVWGRHHSALNDSSDGGIRCTSTDADDSDVLAPRDR
jgi:hypothetical protein